MSPTFIAFMCHAPTSEYQYLEDTLQEYNIGNYLIGHEISPYEHYHFLVEMTTADYHLFAERVFRKKFKLRGRAKDGNARQYGKIKNIEDLEKLKSYTIKDGNYRSNMPEQDVAKYFETSFKKAEKKKIYEEISEYLEENFQFNFTYDTFLGEAKYYEEKRMTQFQKNIYQIKLNIINYLRINTDINMCRSNINSYTQFFLKKTSMLSDYQKDQLIFQLLF